MTLNQIYRVIRSLQYREEKSQDIPRLKAQLLAEVQARGPLLVAGYRVWEHDGELIIKQLPTIPINQLPLALEFLDEAEASQAEISQQCLTEGLCYACEQPVESPRPHCDCPCHAVVL